MAKQFQLEVVTPERIVFKESVEFVTVPTVDGIYGMLAEHAPMVGLLKPGVVHYRQAGDVRALAISGGFFEVDPRRTVVLADEAELPEEIDVAAAVAERDRAREVIEAGGDQGEVARAKEALERALARLRATGRA